MARQSGATRTPAERTDGPRYRFMMMEPAWGTEDGGGGGGGGIRANEGLGSCKGTATLTNQAGK